MPSPVGGSPFLIDPDAAELTILVEHPPSRMGWEQILTDLERHVALVDIVILAGAGWATPIGRRVELVLRESLPQQGVPVVHAEDAVLEAWRAVPRKRRGPGPRHRAPAVW